MLADSCALNFRFHPLQPLVEIQVSELAHGSGRSLLTEENGATAVEFGSRSGRYLSGMKGIV